ncbi:hypothetical protein C2G38_2085393 [Gigaspora rosea]|uniref:Uncharacterized protein n=1 Tax=Gigaspora rosea TaxID=44941 RepID=A0A397V9D0_9GLOM|nr:hypothetical protein C2G38_2085393 [Gigaspora rosea]
MQIHSLLTLFDHFSSFILFPVLIMIGDINGNDKKVVTGIFYLCPCIFTHHPYFCTCVYAIKI